jgi:hypothetical protein
MQLLSLGNMISACMPRHCARPEHRRYSAHFRLRSPLIRTAVSLLFLPQSIRRFKHTVHLGNNPVTQQLHTNWRSCWVAAEIRGRQTMALNALPRKNLLTVWPGKSHSGQTLPLILLVLLSCSPPEVLFVPRCVAEWREPGWLAWFGLYGEPLLYRPDQVDPATCSRFSQQL